MKGRGRTLRILLFALRSFRLRDLGRSYDAVAGEYNGLFGENQSAYADALVRHCRAEGMTGYGRALDIGAGTGILTRRLPELAEAAFGLDLSTGMLRIAEQEKTDSEPIHFVRGNMLLLPFSDGTFDLLTCLGTLSHVRRRDFGKFSAEVLRVTRPGADILFAMTPFPWRMYTHKRSCFFPTRTDRVLCAFYNGIQAAGGLPERRGIHNNRFFARFFGEAGCEIQAVALDGLTLVTCCRSGSASHQSGMCRKGSDGARAALRPGVGAWNRPTTAGVTKRSEPK